MKCLPAVVALGMILSLPALGQTEKLPEKPVRVAGELRATNDGVAVFTAAGELVRVHAYAHPRAQLRGVHPYTVGEDLRVFAGSHVELEGVLHDEGALRITRVVSPVFVAQQEAIVLLDLRGQPALQGVGSVPLPVVGPLVDMLRCASGTRIVAELWCVGPKGAPTSVRVRAVRGRLLRSEVSRTPAWHTRNTEPTELQRGTELWIRSWAKGHARVWLSGASTAVDVSAASITYGSATVAAQPSRSLPAALHRRPALRSPSK